MRADCANSWENDRTAHLHPARVAVPRVSEPASVAPHERSAGTSHEHLGLFAHYSGPPPTSHHYHPQTVGYSEEQRRQFLLQGERARKHAASRQAPTDTLGLRASASDASLDGDARRDDDDDRWTTTSHAEHSYHSTFLPRRQVASRPIESNEHTSFGSYPMEA